MLRLNKIIVCLLFLFVYASSLHADESIYGFSEVDYFNMKELKKPDTSKIEAAVDKQEAPVSQDLWIEPAISADGKVSYYKPPQVVVDFLDNPTTENGKAYLSWNQQKLAKITKAQEVLQELASEMNLIPSSEPPQGASGTIVESDPDQKPVFAAFFLLKGCPYCEKEKALISEFFNRPGIHVEVYGKNYTEEDIKQLPFPAKIDDGVSRQLGLNTYPSVFVQNKYGKRLIMPGLIDIDAFNTLLEQ